LGDGKLTVWFSYLKYNLEPTLGRLSKSIQGNLLDIFRDNYKMKIYVDATESKSLGNKLYETGNIERTKKELQTHIKSIKSIISKCKDDEDYLKELEKELENKVKCWNLCDVILSEKTIRKSKKEASKMDMLFKKDDYENLLDNHTPYQLPQFTDNKQVKEKSLNDTLKQGDFVVMNRGQTPTIIELKATFATLKDAILNPYPLFDTREQVKNKDVRFYVLVVLPDENDELTRWLVNNQITKEEFSYFMNHSKLPIRKLRLKKEIYNELCMDYFLDEPNHRALLKKKHRAIIEKVLELHNNNNPKTNP